MVVVEQEEEGTKQGRIEKTAEKHYTEAAESTEVTEKKGSTQSWRE